MQTVREATIRYIARPVSEQDDESLALIVPEVEAAVAEMNEAIRSMREGIAQTCAKVDAVLAGETR